MSHFTPIVFPVDDDLSLGESPELLEGAGFSHHERQVMALVVSGLLNKRVGVNQKQRKEHAR